MEKRCERENVAAAFLGQFRMTYKGVTITEETIRSEMVTKLLAYILLHRSRNLPVRELAETLWSNGESSDNPAGALKNLMYRLRNILKKYFGDEVQFVLTNLGAYCWNPEVPVELDVETFEELIKRAKSSGTDSEQAMVYYSEAIDLYRGYFLDNYSSEHWVVPVTAYYHSMFLTTAKNLAALYEKAERYEEMEAVSSRATRYDNLDEELHCMLLSALVRQGKDNVAREHYDKTVKLFYEQLGIHNPPKLEKAYKEILTMKKVSGAARIEEINEDIQETGELQGAYICSYIVFQELYRIEARRINRMGISEYVMLLTLTLKQNGSMVDATERYLLNRAMDRMEEILRSSLRIGDVAARYSESQFIVLLPTCTYEAGQMIVNRITAQFHQDIKNKKFSVAYNIEEVTASENSFIK